MNKKDIQLIFMMFKQICIYLAPFVFVAYSINYLKNIFNGSKCVNCSNDFEIFNRLDSGIYG